MSAVEEIRKFIFDNQVGSGLAVVILGAAGTFVMTALRKRRKQETDERDYKAVYDFLSTGTLEWRSPDAISREAKLPLARVRNLLENSDRVTKMINPPKDLWRMR